MFAWELTKPGAGRLLGRAGIGQRRGAGAARLAGRPARAGPADATGRSTVKAVGVDAAGWTADLRGRVEELLDEYRTALLGCLDGLTEDEAQLRLAGDGGADPRRGRGRARGPVGVGAPAAGVARAGPARRARRHPPRVGRGSAYGDGTDAEPLIAAGNADVDRPAWAVPCVRTDGGRDEGAAWWS